jgi:hypothetical protein
VFSHRKTVIVILLLLTFGLILHAKAETRNNPPDGDMLSELKTSPLLSDMMEALSNRQVHPFEAGETKDQFDLTGFELAAETKQAELWLNKEWNTVRIRNKNTGYIWGALPLEEAEGLNKTWNNYGNSIAAIECFDETGTEGRYSLTSDAITSYTARGNGFLCHADFKEIGISFNITVTLDNNRLTFRVEEESISEGNGGSAYRLKSLTFMPYLGSVYSDSTEGYLFIPDGPGALVRFQKPAQYTATFAGRVYGKDLGIEALAQPSDLQAYRPNDYAVDEPQVIMPVYAVVHGVNQNGLFAVIENGAEYATILAAPALQNNPYNWEAARFEFRQKYNKNINRKKGAGAVVPQEHKNELSPELSVYITDGQEAHYDGMAGLYRSLLYEKGVLKKQSGDSDSYPMKVELLGAGLRDEFIGKSLRVFTDAKGASRIADRLAGLDISDLSFIYKCYTKNNEAGKALLDRLGGKGEIQALVDKVTGNGGRFYFYLNPVSANEDQINKRTEAANNLSNMVIELSRNNRSVLYPNTYFYRLDEVGERIADAAALRKFDKLSGFALDELSYRLYGDFTSGKETTRAQNLETSVELVKQAANGQKIPLYQPNQYLWSYASEFYNIPLSGGQFLYETDTVPFLQIVLSGSLQSYGIPLNVGTYSTERILRHIEYGVAPSFTVTECDSMLLYRTTQEDYISTNYGDWEAYIKEAYDMISSALTRVRGHAITEHKALEDGFIRVSYDNGINIYVNYTAVEQSDGAITVEPGWFRVVP